MYVYGGQTRSSRKLLILPLSAENTYFPPSMFVRAGLSARITARNKSHLYTKKNKLTCYGSYQLHICWTLAHTQPFSKIRCRLVTPMMTLTTPKNILKFFHCQNLNSTKVTSGLSEPIHATKGLLHISTPTKAANKWCSFQVTPIHLQMSYPFGYCGT